MYILSSITNNGQTKLEVSTKIYYTLNKAVLGKKLVEKSINIVRYNTILRLFRQIKQLELNILVELKAKHGGKSYKW